MSALTAGRWGGLKQQVLKLHRIKESTMMRIKTAMTMTVITMVLCFLMTCDNNDDDNENYAFCFV